MSDARTMRKDAVTAQPARAAPGLRPAVAGRSPAEIYDEQFVPALFRQWGPVVADAAQVGPGQSVLDVACGTGALTAVLAERVGVRGTVVGLDANPQMLEVARRKSLNVEWRHGRAVSLPFDSDRFDAVASQFGLMFFEDRGTALRELTRVLRPGGHLAVAVCDGLDRSAGYAALAALLQRLFGDTVAEAFRAPFALGEPTQLRSLCDRAGIPEATVTRRAGTVRFESIAALVATERACVWTLGGLLDDEQFERLLKEAAMGLLPFADARGQVTFEMPALIITAGRT